MQQLDLLGEGPTPAAPSAAGIDRLDDGVKAAIRGARMQGRSYRQLAEEHGTTPEAIRAVCRS